ncbi:cold shock domain-containing protein C2 isoform X1 [Cyrtonyx montezumae]|uniref:cold shock domain-containing protein C2 isoform X1 n=1 Tax=Cyrtonyx montezumae TaxID=9017 RepID=UPI0032DB795F
MLVPAPALWHMTPGSVLLPIILQLKAGEFLLVGAKTQCYCTGFNSGHKPCNANQEPEVDGYGQPITTPLWPCSLLAADPCLLLPTPGPDTEDPTDPTMSSEPGAPPAVPPLHSPKSPVWPTFPFQREGSRVWERGNLLLRDLPSPLPTKRTRTYSATARASAGPIYKGVCKQFSRSQGHGFITPENGTEDIFVHVSDIEGEYVPVEGDEVTYKVCPIPPKNQKFQAVEVVLTNLAPHTKHETWSGQIIGS